jgi:hypothetical protein
MRRRQVFVLDGELGKLGEIVEEGAAGFAPKDFGHAGDGARRLVEGDAFDAGHGKENRREPDAFGVELIDFADEMIEGVDVNAAHGDAARIDGAENAPDFFLGSVQANDDDGVWIHGYVSEFFLSVADAGEMCGSALETSDQPQTDILDV